DVTAQAVTDYLNAQIEAGAQAVMIFDTWGGTLTPHAYREFSLAYITRIVAGLKREAEGRRVPSIVFTKGGGLWLEDIADCGADAVGVDWTIPLGEARQRVGNGVALQGNLDPSALLGDADAVRREARQVLDSYGDGPGHVFNLGHGISQYADPDNVIALVDTVHTLSRRPV
ncbi:MAG TPA: uroporphyrinogen decarboxylase family protein, partial [Bryobacteraceae bacterium]|nr:uroporphyrinogen decarboxylase family protein [Bryobacteraceae bacterium]